MDEADPGAVGQVLTDGAAPPVRWGVLSTALITQKLLCGARLCDDVEVLAVASRDPARSRTFAEANGIPRAHESYEDLLADPDVDAVYVPLPNSMHHEWTMRALEAGKHVLCEKPYSRHPGEVTEAFDLADARGLVLSEAYMYRYHPQTRRVLELVREGAVGELRILDGSFTWPCWEPGDVRLDPALEGGCLLDVGCYPISALRLLAGEPESVAAQQVIGDTGVDVRLTALLRLPHGVLGHIDCGFGVPDRSTLQVLGTAGRIQVQDPWHIVSPGIVLEREGRAPERFDVPESNSYALELQAVGAAIAGDRSAALGREDALGQSRSLAAVRRAAEAGTTVDVTPAG